MTPEPDDQSQMVDPQTPGKVTGYLPQPREHVELVNQIKELENALGRKVALLAQRRDVDQRMLEIGRTNLQQGFMWTVRSLFQPKSEL